MAFNFLDPKNERSINQYFRKKRFGFFKNLINQSNSKKTVKLLDIGGTLEFWENMKFTEQPRIQICLLNIDPQPIPNSNIKSIKGDACDLSMFKDKEFDIVFSNSVIEHLFTFNNQKKMADEVRRVGKNYFIQTPNYYFPVEPHWLFPFFQFLPFKLKVFLSTYVSLGHYKKTLDKEKAVERVNEVRLLTEKEMKELFPEGKVYKEKVFGFTKSLILYYFNN